MSPSLFWLLQILKLQQKNYIFMIQSGSKFNRKYKTKNWISPDDQKGNT